jgi:hypothetical protein
MHSLMSHVGAETCAHLASHSSSWQDSYYETRVKTPRQCEYIAWYIEQNPVAAGLVENRTSGLRPVRRDWI